MLRRLYLTILLLMIPALVQAGERDERFGLRDIRKNPRSLYRINASSSWTPASPDADGVSMSHWWSAQNTCYQDSAKTTVAASDGDVVGHPNDYYDATSGVSQPTTDNKPTLQVAEVNGKRAWRLDGSNDYWRGPFATISQPYTVYLVAKLDGTVINNNTYYVATNGYEAGHSCTLFKETSTDPDKFAINTETGAEDTQMGANADGNWHLWIVEISDATTATFWLDGVQQATSAAVTTSTLSGIVIGAFTDLSFPWKGDIAEVAIRTGGASSTAKNQWGSYAQKTYGISQTTIP